METALVKARLPGAVRELLDAAIASGRPADMMQELVDLDRMRRDMRRRILMIFAYPTFILGAVACVTLFFGLFLVPAFAVIFDDFEIELPAITKVVLFVTTTWFPLFLLLVLLLVAAATAIWMFPASAVVERFTYWIPLIGGLRRYSRLMRFSRLAALLIEQKRPLPDALRWAGESSGSPQLKDVAKRLALGIEQGESLDRLMDRERTIPPTMVPGIRWGLENDRLGESFRAAECAFSGRATTQAEYVGVLILPMTLLIVVSVLPVIVISLFLPLISVIQSLT